MANDREITQKKQRPGLSPNDIKTVIFETTGYKSFKDYFVLQCRINNFT